MLLHDWIGSQWLEWMMCLTIEPGSKDNINVFMVELNTLYGITKLSQPMICKQFYISNVKFLT